MAKLYIILLAGQSLASGEDSKPPFATVNSGNFWMLGQNIGSSAMREGNAPIDAGALIQAYDEPQQESILGGFTRYMQKNRPDDKFAYAYAGVSGTHLDFIAKPQSAYSKAIEQIARFKTFAQQQGLEPHLTIFMINGESDTLRYNQVPAGSFSASLSKYRKDIATDTGLAPKMFMSQTSGHAYARLFYEKIGAAPLPSKFPTAAIDQSALANNNQDYVMVGAKQDLPYVDDYSWHLTPDGSSQHGEKFAQVFEQVIIKGGSWKPLQLRSAKLKNATTIVADFDVPVPPLAWDETIVDPGARGFSLASGIALNNISIISSTQVELTMAAPFNTGVDRLQYAWDNWVGKNLYNSSNYPGQVMGKKYGSRGQLQDSDKIPGSPYNQSNHCIHCSTTIFGLDTRPPDPLEKRRLLVVIDGNNQNVTIVR